MPVHTVAKLLYSFVQYCFSTRDILQRQLTCEPAALLDDLLYLLQVVVSVLCIDLTLSNKIIIQLSTRGSIKFHIFKIKPGKKFFKVGLVGTLNL